MRETYNSMKVVDLLSHPSRRWTGQPGASEELLLALRSRLPVSLPEAFFDLMRHSNGGEGDLALAPLLFVLDPVEVILEGLADPFLRDEFTGIIFIGGNGGLERIGFDVRDGCAPWPVVAIDPIAGLESAEIIATSFDAFVEAIGLTTPCSDSPIH